MRWTDKLEQPLVRALQSGASALPADIDRLAGYMALIQELLGEKAVEVEPTWALACDSAAEVETLQDLERAVVERAVGLRLHDLGDVLAKFAIWRALVDEGHGRLRDRLVMSIESDLLTIAGGGRRRI